MNDDYMDEEEMEIPTGDYETHVIHSNALYAIEFERFEAALTPEERSKLLRSGAMRHVAPEIEEHKAVTGSHRMMMGITKDAADSSLACERPDMAAAVDTKLDELLEMGVPRDVVVKVGMWHEALLAREATTSKASLIVTFAGVFLRDSNVRLTAAGLAYAADLALVYGMGSMDSWARKHGLSRQAVSKVANRWKRELGLLGGSHMRDEKTCQAYSEAQKTKHWRKKSYGTVPTRQ